MIRVLIRQKPARKNYLLYFIDPKSGKEVSRSARTSNRDDALRAAAKWEQELLNYRGAADNGWPHFRHRFLTEHCSGLSKASTVPYTTALNHYERLMKPRTAADVSADTLSTFRVTMTGEGQSVETVAKHLRHIRAALSWAKSVGMISEVPTLKKIRQAKKRWMRGRPLTEAEYLAMLKAAPSPAWKRFLELLWHSGLRISEALLLNWNAPPLYVQLDAKPFPQLVIFGEGQKSGHDETTPISPEFFDWLSATPEKKRYGRVAPLPSTRVDEASRSISAIGEAAGVQVDDERFASAHDLRRSFGSRWALQVPPLVLQKMMRHASLETTLKFYVGLDSGNVGSAIWGSRKGSRNPPQKRTNGKKGTKTTSKKRR